MSETKRISSALISVFHKDGLDEIINKLHEEGVKLISTGGTQRFIESLGVPCQAVEELTGYPSIPFILKYSAAFWAVVKKRTIWLR